MKTKEEFEYWYDNLVDTIADYEYYVDFKDIYKNVNNVKVKLNILNSLIGSKDIENEFEQLIYDYPEVVDCIPLLIAVRKKEIKLIDNNEQLIFNFSKIDDIELLKKFMRKIGLFDLMSNRISNNLVDYVTGIEVGLYSNTRKNKGGHLMEDIIEVFLQNYGLIKDKTYFKEMYLNEIQEKWNIDLSSLKSLGKDRKRFDFVVKLKDEIYVIESSFYNANGSKLNETARSYELISNECKKIDNFNFIWITDGYGWKQSKKIIEKAYYSIDNIY
ncbi:MAG: type II restriction endonuclease, partial [Ureaplasma sp.]|nr:type II restriction endonuclease [Ureaplasma sp.]